MKKLDLKNLNSRIIRACKLDETLYEDIRGDKNALSQATLVVVLSSFAAGIGSISLIWKVGTIAAIIIGTLAALLGWCFWILIIYFVGMKIFAKPYSVSTLDFWQFAQFSGFAASAGLIRVLGSVAFVGTFVSFLSGIWLIAAMSVAIKKIFELDIRKSVFVCIISWLIEFIIIAVAVSLFINIKGAK
ncbi:MAG: YIP1 family protein [Candidatus Omnitrophota bacterium]